jgi:hypothetical protein
MSDKKIASVEFILFPVARYRNEAGIPICSVNPNHHCSFLSQGTRIREESFCTGLGEPSLKRLKFDEELGTFPILEGCPIWSNKVKEISIDELKEIAEVSL